MNTFKMNPRGSILLIMVFLGAFTIFRIFLENSTNLFRTASVKKVKAVKAHANSKGFLGTFNIVYVEENINSLDQRDPLLIEYVRYRHLTPPSKLPDTLGTPGRDKFGGFVADFFRNKTNGFYIEAGVNDGKQETHTSYLEKVLGWQGLLVECNPLLVPYLRSTHRKAWIADVCLSTFPNAATFQLNFSYPLKWSASGTLATELPSLPVKTNWTHFEVQAIPLYTILAALGWTDIDYFAFDIEKAELAVLQNFPFDLVRFKVLIVEIFLYGSDEIKELHSLLISKGYEFVKDMDKDKIYVHQDFKHMLSVFGTLNNV